MFLGYSNSRLLFIINIYYKYLVVPSSTYKCFNFTDSVTDRSTNNYQQTLMSTQLFREHGLLSVCFSRIVNLNIYKNASRVDSISLEKSIDH